ncbi:MAG: class II fructose-bisphosphate aldolase [Clostridiales bacterium]|jgi:fructose-bisphosphate aldolase class II|nr:class II fructose-bisphosphate aldolase [Clostridiales bacterium]
MSIVRSAVHARELYESAKEKGWVLPCFCSENLTTTEAILSAAEAFRIKYVLPSLPVIVAITCRYEHRSQASFYTHTRRWDTGLKLFTNDIKALCEDGGPFERLDVMIHLDHLQHDLDMELLESALTDYASVMYDASALPFEENIQKTADYCARHKNDVLIEGACDEIQDAGGKVHNELTTPAQAKRYIEETGADLIVCNLGTEHRASGKELKYSGEASRAIQDGIGKRIVLHGTSSVPNEQVRHLFNDGVCKVNIWTALERDSSPVLFEDMVRNAGKLADNKTLLLLANEGLIPAEAMSDKKMELAYFTTLYRQGIVFDKMRSIVSDYFDMWYV